MTIELSFSTPTQITQLQASNLALHLLVPPQSLVHSRAMPHLGTKRCTQHWQQRSSPSNLQQSFPKHNINSRLHRLPGQTVCLEHPRRIEAGPHQYNGVCQWPTLGPNLSPLSLPSRIEKAIAGKICRKSPRRFVVSRRVPGRPPHRKEREGKPAFDLQGFLTQSPGVPLAGNEKACAKAI